MKGKRQRSRAQPDNLGARKQNVPAFISDIAPAIVMTLLILYALVALLSVDLAPDNTSTPVFNSEQRVSDLGLGFAFRR